MSFTKKDFWFALFTGFYAGLIAWLIAGFLKLPPFNGWSYAWLIIAVPVLWVIGVWLGYWLGRWLAFFSQFGKFSAIGFTNAAVDFGILNLEIALTGITGGVAYAGIRTVAAVIAVNHSYFWNRTWVFASRRENIAGEFVKFVVAAGIAAAINIGAASAVVNLIKPLAGFSPERWANLGAVIGSAVALAVNFVILRQRVFKQKN